MCQDQDGRERKNRSNHRLRKRPFHDVGTTTTTSMTTTTTTIRKDGIPLSISLPILVMIDMVAVALVVPLLSGHYFPLCGLKTANHLEFFRSLFSGSQIVGGILVGRALDSSRTARPSSSSTTSPSLPMSSSWTILSPPSMSGRTILIISFLGSVGAYLAILFAGGPFGHYGLPALVVSQLLVGFVKHTMTITTGMLATHLSKNVNATNTTDNDSIDDNGKKSSESSSSNKASSSSSSSIRSVYMARLSASATVAWIVGPSIGSYMFSHVGTYAPIYVACGLFLLNAILAILFLPATDNEINDDNEDDKVISDHKTTTVSDQREHKRTVSQTGADTTIAPSASEASCQQPKNSSTTRRTSNNFLQYFQLPLSLQSAHGHKHNDQRLVYTVMALLLFQFVSRATSYRSISTYYERMYGVQSHQRGYIQSYQSALTFVVQSSLVRPLLDVLGGEINATWISSLILACVSLVEIYGSFRYYVALLCPLNAIGLALLGVCLKSLVCKVSPKSSLNSVFASIDVLQNIAMVTVPFYRTVLFGLSQSDDGAVDDMGTVETASITTTIGDPDPKVWLIISALHWILAAVAFSYLLIASSSRNADGSSTGWQQLRSSKYEASNPNLQGAQSKVKVG